MQHFFGTIAVRPRRQRDANGVADAFGQQNREAGGARDDSLRAESRFGKSEVQRVVAACGEPAVDIDQILHAGDLGRDDDPIVAQSDFFGDARRSEVRSGASPRCRRPSRVARLGSWRVLVHHVREKILIERAPVDANAYRLVVVERRSGRSCGSSRRAACRRRCRG